MTREEADQLAYNAVRDAKGKTITEAVAIISDAIFIAAQPKAIGPETFTIETDADTPGGPIAPKLPPPKITELAPIRVPPTPPRSVVRVRHSSEEMQEAVMENMPAALEILPQGHKEPLTLYRSMMADAGNPPSLQVVYKFKDHDAEAPYVKVFLWSTDEKAWDFPAIIAKLKSDAESMYRLRTNAIRTSVVNLGAIETRYAKRENV